MSSVTGDCNVLRNKIENVQLKQQFYLIFNDQNKLTRLCTRKMYSD